MLEISTNKTNQSPHKLNISKFDLGEINGGWQTIIRVYPISEKEYYVVASGLPPHDEIIKKIREQDIVTYEENLTYIQNEVQNNDILDSLFINLPRGTIFRCFKLTEKENNKYLFEEFVTADSIHEIGELCRIQNILVKSIPECLTEEEFTEIMNEIANSFDLNDKKKQERNNSLLEAVNKKDVQLVQELIENGADINYINDINGSKKTALQLAIKNSDKEMVSLLVKNGADVNLEYPLELTSDKEIITILREHGAKTRTEIEEEINYFEYTKNLAENGDIKSMCILAFCYYEGLGIKKDNEKSFEWFKKAAELGHVDAMKMLANYYNEGIGTEKNEKKAFEWNKKANDLGYTEEEPEKEKQAEAFFKLGLLTICEYHDTKKAIEYFETAARLGHISSLACLAECYLNEDICNYDKAFQLAKSAAEKGDSTGQLLLAFCYQEGYGIEKNIELAAMWYTKAAEQGNADAQYRIGLYYQHGLGVPKNLQKAIEWFTKAAEQGNANAREKLGLE